MHPLIPAISVHFHPSTCHVGSIFMLSLPLFFSLLPSFFPPFFCPPQWTLTLAAASRLAQFRTTRKSFPHVSSRVQVSISLLSDFTMLIHNAAPDCKEYTRPATSVPQCWSCHRGVSLKEKFFCSSCGAIQPTKDKNFFEIFNVYLSLQHSLIFCGI